MDPKPVFEHVTSLLVCGAFLFAGTRMVRGEFEPLVGDPFEVGLVTLALGTGLFVLNTWKVIATIWREVTPTRVGGRERGYSARVWMIALYLFTAFVVLNVAASA